MADTAIEWASKVWNPVVGCSVISPGCKNCYAMRMASRLEAMASKPDGTGNFHLDHYIGTVEPSRAGPVWTGRVNVAPDDTFLAPLRRKKPTDYFVNSMSDLFHPEVPFEVVDRVFAIMALTPQHTYKILTKRSARMREYLTGRHRNPQGWPAEDYDAQTCIRLSMNGLLGGKTNELGCPDIGYFLKSGIADRYGEADKRLFHNWPLSNVWLGVSVEDQKRADERIPDLLATPAAVRWISAEPLLEEVLFDPCDLARIDWVVAGGENGPRPMHPDWARSLRDQCAVAGGVPFFFKQNGTWDTVFDRDRDDPDWRDCSRWQHEYPKGRWLNMEGGTGFHGDRVIYVTPVGKQKAGRLLDGIEHNAMPEARHG